MPHNPAAASLLRAALVLCADHELNVSAFTARCVASANATPYAVVIAGLAALQGAKHGGYTDQVEAFLSEVATPERASTVITHRLKRGERVPGFGHPLYPDGDPRAKALFTLTMKACPKDTAIALGKAVATQVQRTIGQQPTIDFALAILASALHLPPGSALALFALGRTIGWIGHAIEQYQLDQLIRPRARYVGPAPQPKENWPQSVERHPMSLRPLVLLVSFFLVMICMSPVIQADDLETIHSRGALRVGVSGDYQPFSVCSEQLTDCRGFDIEVAQRVATDLGVRLELVRFRWPDLRTDLAAGKFDVAMSGVTLRPERILTATFTRPYTVAQAVVLVADRARFPSLSAVDHDGVRVAVNAGGHLEQVARARFRTATV
jgi:hypothetical protein